VLCFDVHAKYPELPFYLQVGNDDTTTADDAYLLTHLLKKYEMLVDQVAQDPDLNRVRVLPQLHTLLWGNKRGV
ncbi:7-carboxy-7-deazaguanine synthase QueE, partial [Bacillus altitudinis]|nr:7-carboxy-7-deazaguanine synthase QueE [Bacillus altitudinis]